MDTANPRKLSNILELSASELDHTLGTMMTTRKARNYATNQYITHGQATPVAIR
jgi:hypothetical protein